MRRNQRTLMIFYVLFAVVYTLTNAGVSFALQRSVRSISVPHRDIDVTMNPGENRQFSHDHLLDFQANDVEVTLAGQNLQHINVVRDSMRTEDLMVHTWFRLFLSEDAPEGQVYGFNVLFTYTNDERETTKQEPYSITVASLEADFAANTVRGEIPLNVQFTDRSTGVGIQTWFWDFGDGQTSRDRNPAHRYQDHGYYDVSLRVTKGDGSQEFKQRWEYIAAVDPDLVELSYEDPDDLPNFLTLPESGAHLDKYYNVRFTPPYPRFRIVEARIALFDLFGDNGTPDMKVIIWESGNQLGEPGYPTTPLDSTVVSFEDLHFGGFEPAYNTVDLRDMNLIYYGPMEFHIGVEVVADAETDSLALYIDDGRYSRTSRSYFWDDDAGVWLNINAEGAYAKPFNFAIHAVVTYQEDAPIVPDPATSPYAVLLNPAYPNPFNSSTTIGFNIPVGVPFTSALFDESGRWIHDIDAGIGTGAGRWVLNKRAFPAGIYILRLTTPAESKSTQLIYVR